MVYFYFDNRLQKKIRKKQFINLNNKIMVNYIIFSAILGAISAIIAFGSDRKIFALFVGILTFLFFSFINWFFTPVLSFWGFDGFWLEIALSTLIGLGFGTMNDDDFNLLRLVPFVLCVIGFVIRLGVTSEMFNSEQYRELIKPVEVQENSFDNNIPQIPLEKMIVVNEKYAKDIASKRIENMPSLGSRCEFDCADMINLNGTLNLTLITGQTVTETFDNEQVWVLPLEHSGYWKWHNNRVTEGYCIVSAHNPSRIFFVTGVNNKPLALRYLKSACFGDYIKRHIRKNGYEKYGLTEYSMELDDSGNPYWVITVYQPTIQFSGEDATGVLVVDMQTGDIKEYSIADAPEWIDRIQPANIVLSQINDWGQYQKGYWNSIFAQDGVVKASSKMSLVYSEGRSYWYTCLQSAGYGKNKGASSFILVDTRTKEAKLYPTAGIDHSAAMNVIDAQSEWARQSKFKTNVPILYNIHGVPTYFMTLTGDGIKNAGYAFVSLKDELQFYAAASIKDALNGYRKVLQNGNSFSVDDGDIIKKVTQTVTVRDIRLINNTYYIIFEEIRGKVFISAFDAFAEVMWTKVGQKVDVSYSDTNDSNIILDSYDIKGFEI